MNTIIHYYLVDFENVGLPGLCGLNMPGKEDEIHFFLSNAAHAATEDVYQDILRSPAQIMTTFCSETHKNAVDFQLAAYFGLILEREETVRISIISSDGGFRSLSDYARKRRNEIVVYHARNILEAYAAAKTTASPRMYVRGKSVDFKQIMASKRTKSLLEAPVLKELGGVYDEDTINKVLEIFQTDNMSKREKYLSLLKTYGREKGTALYRLIRNHLP